jgi:hypothetical protein
MREEGKLGSLDFRTLPLGADWNVWRWRLLAGALGPGQVLGGTKLSRKYHLGAYIPFGACHHSDDR